MKSLLRDIGLGVALCALYIAMTLGSIHYFCPKCPPGQCPGHLTRFHGVGYCDPESCLKHNPWATKTVDMWGDEKR